MSASENLYQVVRTELDRVRELRRCLELTRKALLLLDPAEIKRQTKRQQKLQGFVAQLEHRRRTIVERDGDPAPSSPTGRAIAELRKEVEELRGDVRSHVLVSRVLRQAWRSVAKELGVIDTNILQPSGMYGAGQSGAFFHQTV